MTIELPEAIALAGAGQLGVLVVSSIVPWRLRWRLELRGISRLHRQMHWVYGGYIALSILAFAVISISNAGELASGTGLARSFCAYAAIFWGVRLVLQGVFDVEAYLPTWRLKIGYVLLTLLFAVLTVIYGWAAMHTRTAPLA